MELFIFPDLIYALVLANLMSPRVWRWHEDAWFAGIERMKPYRRILRLKQYIMDHYMFNLDLDTWGLTTKERELARFQAFIDADTLAKSNALFGYEGDRYYFDIDIRTHFGLDKYAGNVIPYWKTETVEAMDAFRHRPNYGTGAGECVSLSTLYAASLFLVAGIPLDDIFLMATPLHSQNFIDLDDGILTNNRRLVSKNMWFNGTALSAQARRALDNERVSLVAHHTGTIHTLYPEATLSPAAYTRFSNRLRDFLKVKFTSDILGNFLRQSQHLQPCFQVRWPIHGRDHYIPAERVFAYEHGSSYQITDATRDKLLAEIDVEEFLEDRLPGRIVLNDLEDFVETHQIDLDVPEDIAHLKEQFASGCLNRERVIRELLTFCHVNPRIPDAAAHRFVNSQEPLHLSPSMSREALIERLESLRPRNRMAQLAFYAYRDLRRTEPEPFLYAALERNPVSLQANQQLSLDQAATRVRALPEESIYDEAGRLAQPDEVWNFGRGDGLEKACLLANLIHARRPGDSIRFLIDAQTVVLQAGTTEHAFPTQKELPDQEWTWPPSTERSPA
jgi:hypothetical protein